jgi:hypothetical protein
MSLEAFMVTVLVVQVFSTLHLSSYSIEIKLERIRLWYYGSGACTSACLISWTSMQMEQFF